MLNIASRPSGPAAEDPSKPARQSVLVIDDDVAVDDSFGEMLSAAGYDVHAEGTCSAGIAYLQNARPSVVILDLHLPDGTGLDCLRRLRQFAEHRDLPVAILTGDYFLDAEVAKELKTLGASVFFKPVWEDDLLRIVRQLLDRREAEGSTGQSSSPRNEP
jgi:DNA-binding response OmpR family regulator